MNAKKLITPAILLVMVLATAISAMAFSGTVSLDEPDTGDVVQGTYQFQINTDIAGTYLNDTTIWAKGPVYTRNSTWFNVSSNLSSQGCANFNSTSLSCNVTWNTAALTYEDASSWQFMVQACNASLPTDCENSTAITAILHTGNPKAPSTMLPATATTDKDGSVSFSATVNGNGTTDCTLYFVAQAQYKAPNGKTAIDMDLGRESDSCTYTFKDVPAGQYQWYISADDDTNETAATTRNVLTIDLPTGTGLRQQVIAQNQATAAARTSTTSNKTVLALVILGIVLYFGVYKKKRR